MSSVSGERLVKRTGKNGVRVCCVWDVLCKRRIYRKKSGKKYIPTGGSNHCLKP